MYVTSIEPQDEAVDDMTLCANYKVEDCIDKHLKNITTNYILETN